MMGWSRGKLGAAGIIVVVIIVGAIIGLRDGDSSDVEYRFSAVDRGDVISSISTSGTLSAVVTVDVGSQVSGQVSELNADFNTIVKEGQLIARIDPQSFEARQRQTEADLAIAKANLSMQTASKARFKADLASAQANLENRRATDDEAQRELARKEELLSRGVASNREVTQAKSQADSASAQTRSSEAALRSAQAQIEVAQAQIENARAQVQQREASLEQALIDLERTFIRAPVNGVVINRQVSLGQTVAASLNAPVLFTIAQDLRQMQVEANIDEADIGQIQVGQQVEFTVDAHGGQTFRGRVKQIRQAPLVVQNVVTYTVIVTANNARQLLLPGMTANVNVVLVQRKDVLRIPNTALRFQPKDTAPAQDGAGSGGAAQGAQRGNQAAQFSRMVEELSLTESQKSQAQEFGQELGRTVRSIRSQGGGQEELMKAVREGRKKFNQQLVAILTEEQRIRFAELSGQRRSAQAQTNQQGRIWVLGEDGSPRAVVIRYGITNGSLTELVDGEITAGDRIIVGAARSARRRGLTGAGL